MHVLQVTQYGGQALALTDWLGSPIGMAMDFVLLVVFVAGVVGSVIDLMNPRPGSYLGEKFWPRWKKSEEDTTEPIGSVPGTGDESATP